MKRTLAVIIPAYKIVFLDRTLNSLANQSCRDFTVYIGDDNSPYDIKSLVNLYMDRLNIVYYRYNENLGGSDLVKQWVRCLNLMQDEEFFCLFSDDDLMESDCIERFYRELRSEDCYDVYHYNLNIIDERENLIRICPDFPHVLSSLDFFRLLYTHKIDARMPEFIFRSKHFSKKGGFVEFDLAFRSDNATVMRCADERGICTISGAKVLWRDSGINLSSRRKENSDISIRKVKATILFFNWLSLHYGSKGLPLSKKQRFHFLMKSIGRLTCNLSLKELFTLLSSIDGIKSNPCLYFYFRCKLLLRILKNKRKDLR